MGSDHTTQCIQQNGQPQTDPDRPKVAVQRSAVFLPPLHHPFCRLLPLSLLLHGSGQTKIQVGAFNPFSKPGNAPHIGLDRGQLFPVGIQ